MIKKAYEKPSMKVVKIQQHQMLCASPGGYDGQTLGTYCGGNDTVTDEDGEDALW